MTLTWLILTPLLGGVLAWIVAARSPHAARWCALAALALTLGCALSFLSGDINLTPAPGTQTLLAEYAVPWIPRLGITFHLAVDGLSLVLILLTLVLGILAVAASWTEITDRVGFFHFNVLWTLAGIIGVFLALDLLLFYFLWELMLVPMYLLIGIWGHENRTYAAVKFFIFTQAGGLLMLLAILGLVFAARTQTGALTFDYPALLAADIAPRTAWWLMLGFFIAFAVKIPAVPLHTWLPDAHSEAPTAGSVILAGLLLKTGGYGLLRFGIPLFPQASAALATTAMTIGVVGILYGALLAFAQTDLKRMIAYTSVSHMGFVLLGAYSGNALAYNGVILQMLCHGLSTGGLFILAGAIQERTHTRDLRRMGGIWTDAPRIGAIGMILALASLGLPGLGNFVAEFVTLLGAYQKSIPLTVIATAGLVLAAVYALWLVQILFHGPRPDRTNTPDLRPRELATCGVIVAALIAIGLYPRLVVQTVAPNVAVLMETTGAEPDTATVITEAGP